MAARQRMMPLLCLLVRLGWQRDPELWTVRCRDGQGRRARLSVHLTATGVSIEAPSPGPARLTLWEAGQLRVALRDADLCFGELADLEERRSVSCPDPARPLQGSPTRARASPATPRGRSAHRRADRPETRHVAGGTEGCLTAAIAPRRDTGRGRMGGACTRVGSVAEGCC